MERKGGLNWRNKRPNVIQTTKAKGGRNNLTHADAELVLSPASQMFHNPHTNMYVVALFGLKKKVAVDVFKIGLQDTLLKHPRFSSIQVPDKFGSGDIKLVRVKVDLDDHVYVPDIDPNLKSPDKFVEDYTSNLSKTSINMSKPLWELHILQVKTTDAEAVAIFHIHHSLGDGASLISVLLSCTRKCSDPNALPTVGVNKRYVTPSKRNVFFKEFMKLWAALTLVWNTVVDVLIFIATIIFLKDTKTPIKGSMGCEFKPKRFVHRTVSLADIRSVKNAANSTVNDVVVGVAVAGLSCYLNRIYASHGKSGILGTTDHLPEGLRVTAIIPLSTKASVGIQDLATIEESKKPHAASGNSLGLINFPINLALRSNPLDYVRDTKRVIDRKKHSLGPLCTYIICGISFKLFGLKAISAIYRRTAVNTTTAFSNVVGSSEEIMLYGHPILYLAPAVHGVASGLTIHFQSYMQKMTIVLSVDPSVIPDPHQLCDDIEGSLALMKVAIST